MANVFATRTGNWSNTAIWNTSALPTTVDDVYSNNFIVYIDNTYQVNSVTNLSAVGITAGGYFVLNDTVTLSANVIGGGANAVACVQFLSAAPATATLVGNLCAVNTTISGPRALIHNGTGTLNVYGNGLGRIKGTGNPADGYIQNQSTGTLNLFGNYIAGINLIVDNRGIWNQSTGTINFVGSLSGGVGGEGLYNNGTGTVNITGNVFAGPGGAGASVNGVSNVNFGTVNISGNVFGTVGGAGVTNGSGGSYNIFGNVFGGPTTNVYGASNSGTGTITVYGTVSGGIGSGAGGINNTSTGIVIVSGSVYGGSGNSAVGGNNNSFGTLIITQSAFGGVGGNAYGAHGFGSGIVRVLDTAIGGTASIAYGAYNSQTGFMYVKRAVANDYGLGSSGLGSVPGIFGSQTGTTIVETIQCGPRGQWPTAGNVFIIPQNTSTATLFTSASAAQVLFTSLSTNIVPPASSVRLGTRYNLNDYTGTCVIPSVSSVLQGVAVDNSVGIAALQPQTIWNYSVLSATDVNSLGGRLANVATVQSIGQQLTALNL